ncbi:MAG: Yip1 family protein [Melioribacteraceae bacterium]
MEEMQNQDAPKMSSVEDAQEEQELSHTDKLVGVFTEPMPMFTKAAKSPARTTDWLIPVFVVIAIAILSQFVLLSNPEIKRQQQDKVIERMEKQFDEAVAKGQMTREQADQQIETMQDNMGAGGVFQTIGIVVGIPVGTFVVFFVLTGFFFAVAKFGLKGAGTYKDVMVAYGLPMYISVIEIIVSVIAAIAMGKFLTGISAADLMGTDKTTLAGFFLSKLNVFSIWFYVVFGIGLAKMNKSDDVKKYIIAIVAIWLGFGLLFHFLTQAVPFLANFAG